MPKTLAICNQKGGVGKTTTAVNLGASLALLDRKVLLVDCDPQGNATSGLGIDKKNLSRSVYDLLLDADPWEQTLVSTCVANLSLIPSHLALSGAEVELVNMPARERRLKFALEAAKAGFEFILIDCPPSLGLLTVNALVASDSVLIPIQCEYYALEGLSQLLSTIRLVQEGLNQELRIEGVLLTMADFRTKLTRDVVDEVRRFFGEKVYEEVIHRSVRLSEAPSFGLPIALYDPSSVGAIGYRALANRLIGQEEEVPIHDGTDTRVGQGDTSTDPGVGSQDRTGEPTCAGEESSELATNQTTGQRADSVDSTESDSCKPVSA